MTVVRARAGPPAARALDAERWASVESFFHEALAREPAVRARWLEEACRDAGTRSEVEALIEAHERPGRLDALAEAVVSPLLAGAARPPAPLDEPLAAPHGEPPALGRYRLLGRLGGGGMGVVYRARDERLEREVALKFLPPHLSADAAAKKRFLVEARAAASLEHPNVCTVHEIDETPDGQLYIVMGCYDGETLDRRIARGPLPVEQAIGIAADIARGLGKAHERGIVHRDIKPSNIVVTSDGVVKILDFGIAKLSDTSLTQAGGVIGTLAYMSPEQAFGEMVDRRADVWALGVVLYEMLAGARPFGGPGEQPLLFSILTQDPAPLAGVRGDVPPELETLLRRALAKRPDDRFPGMPELLAALAALAAPRPPDPLQAGAAAFAPDARAAPAHLPATDSPLTREGERRQAAVVVTGIADYASLVERLSSEEVDRLTTAVRDAAVAAAEHHGGIVNHFGAEDAAMLFGVTEAHEDDALRAVRATLELHARVRALGTPLEARGVRVRMRSGVHTGPVVAQRQRSGDRRFRITGAPPEVAARLTAFADADAILVSPECRRLVAGFVEAVPAAPVALHAGSPPVIPHRVSGGTVVQTRLELAERTALTPYAGRSRELGALQERLAAAIGGAGGVTVVIGEAGSGKSRLLHELRRDIERSDACLVMGRCDAYGGTTPYLPFIQALRELLGLGGAERCADAPGEVAACVRAVDPSLGEFVPLYLALLSIRSEERPLPRHLQGKELHAAMLEAIAALVTLHAERRPTVLLLEDWHWADEASRAALEQLGEMASAHRLLIVVSCRPDAGVSWTTGEHRTLVHLGPLDHDASLEIMRAVLGVPQVAPDLALRLHERTGGNPFFLEETCHALGEAGAVVVRSGEAAADGSAVQLPETVQAVIRTRLDRLDPEARDALRVASVIGREFARGVLDEVAGAPAGLTGALERLRGSGLVQQTAVVPEPHFRFKHVLTQEVAYDTLLEHQRRALHEAAGRAIERRYADGLDEHLARLAHHFSRAGQWDAAVRYGIRAADRAAALSQLADALGTLDRVLEWIARRADADGRRELTSDVLLRQERLCETLGLRQRQLGIAGELIALLAPHGSSAKLAEAYLRQGDVCTLIRRFDAADRALATALRIARERSDRSAERNVVRSIGLLRSHEGRLQDAIAAFEESLAIDHELGEAPAAAADLASLGNMFRKVGRHAEALRALEAALGGLTAEANWMKLSSVKVVIAAVHRDLGDIDGALRWLDGLASEAVEHRNSIQASFALLQTAHIRLEQGRIEESLDTYRQAVDLTRRSGHTEGLVQSLRAIGEVLVGLGRWDEALPPLREAAALFGQLEDRDAEALMWSRIATAHERCAQPAESHAAWGRALSLAALAGDRGGEAAALEGIARSARQRGMRTEAIGRYRDALARAVESGDRDRELSLRNTLGILHWEDGAYQDALAEYEPALRLCRTLEDRVHEGLVLNSLGATLLRLRRYDEARTVVEDAARVNAATGERRLEAHSLALLGELLLALGRAPEARRPIETSLAIRRELGDRLGEGWMLEHLARVLRAQSRAQEAEAAERVAAAIARETGDATLSRALRSGGGEDRSESTKDR